mgnify:CR=1 FL=1
MKIKKIMSTLMGISILCMTTVFAGGESQLVDKAWDVANTVLWAGYAVALGMVVYIGIKYITGAADAKANMKTAIVNYLIGAFIVFTATTIAAIVFGVATNNGDAGGLASEIVGNAEDAAGL